jgi:hypothetical protein
MQPRVLSEALCGLLRRVLATRVKEEAPCWATSSVITTPCPVSGSTSA